MVPKSAHQRKAIVVLIVGIFLLSFGFGVAVAYFVNRGGGEIVDGGESLEVSDPEPEPEPEPEVVEIDFQPLVKSWAEAIGGSKGVIIYDLDLEKVVGAYNADRKFATASLYKLFVVYQGYRLLQSGEWSGEARAGYTGFNVLECLDKAIRESHSPCAETLWGMIGRDNLDAAVQDDFGLDGFVVGNLSATPREIMEMMRIYWAHTEITDEALVARIKDSFLKQPVTTYNWRQGLPSGFSDKVLVYNKVGWNWNGSMWTIYDDAAILDFTVYERHFIVVVMTSGVAYQQIRNFGAQIEKLVNAELAKTDEASEVSETGAEN